MNFKLNGCDGFRVYRDSEAIRCTRRHVDSLAVTVTRFRCHQPIDIPNPGNLKMLLVSRKHQ